MTSLAQPPRGGLRRRAAAGGAALVWPALVTVLVICGALVPLLFDPHFYWVGDTESGAYGQWYAIGTRLLDGHWWDVLNPTVWQAGVYLADGAWGFYSPILWALGLAAHSAEHIETTVIVLKVLVLVAAALGTYVLCRSFRLPAPWAALAAVAVPFGGFTSYQDITSWITGAIAWSVFPWAWVGLRAVVHRNRIILAALVPAALLLGIVYTHATLTLVALVICVGVEALATRLLGAILRWGVTAVLIAAMVLVAHLPALLVYPDTNRAQGILNTGDLVATPGSLLQAGTPFARALMQNTAGALPGHALSYMAWFLPLAVLVDWARCWRLLRRALSLPLFTVVILFAISAPSQVGPLRWPARLLPYATVAIVVLVVFGLARARVPAPTRIRIAIGIVLVAAASWVSYTGWTQGRHLIAAGTLLVLVLLTVTVLGLTRFRRRPLRGRRVATIVFACLATVAVLVPQRAATPIPGGPAQHLATSLSVYQHMLAGSKGDVFVVGNERSAMSTAMSEQAALGNSWYLTGKPVQNTYTTLQYAAYVKLLCMGVKGSTCSLALYHLFDVAPGTGKRWVDLFGISSILLIKATFFTDAWSHSRPGFHVVSDTPQTRLLVRNTPIPGAGGVVWTSKGTTIRTDSVSATGVTFTVESTVSGGRVALSRLPWPGYTVGGGARIAAKPTAGMLLTVDLPNGAAGRTFTVRYAPPGFSEMIAAATAGGVLLVVWLALWIAGMRVRRLRILHTTAGRDRRARMPETARGPGVRYQGLDAASSTTADRSRPRRG